MIEAYFLLLMVNGLAGGLTLTLAIELTVIVLLFVWLVFLEESLDLFWFTIGLLSVAFTFCFT